MCKIDIVISQLRQQIVSRRGCLTSGASALEVESSGEDLPKGWQNNPKLKAFINSIKAEYKCNNITCYGNYINKHAYPKHHVSVVLKLHW